MMNCARKLESVGIIPIVDKTKATRTKLRTEDGPQGAARRRMSITYQCLGALLEGWSKDACYPLGVYDRQGAPGSAQSRFF
jgi:hypothetical protein